MNDAHSVEQLHRQAGERYGKAERALLRKLYLRWIQPRLSPLGQQRAKLVYRVWGYWPLLFDARWSIADRLTLLRRFLSIDWNVPHGHLPSEIVAVMSTLAERRALDGEVMVEAGCWQGGSSAKFSILCKLLGYELWIYDSFEGVEVLTGDERTKEWDFGGQYASPRQTLNRNLARYGEPDVCSSFPGWFSDTLAKTPVQRPVRVAFIDCDLGKGTSEALAGIVPALVRHGSIFSQDYHIDPVRRVLHDPATWSGLGKGSPRIEPLGIYLAKMRFPDG